MKLFKKALAAVLAGVMALSMVACAPATTETETEIKVDPAAPVASQILEYVNKYSVAKVTDGTLKNSVEFKNELVADAQAVLDVLTAGELDQYGNSVKLSAAQVTALTNAQRGGYTYVISAGDNGMKSLSGLLSNNSFRLSDVEYKKDKVEGWIRANYVGTTTTAQPYQWVVREKNDNGSKVAANIKVGIASAEINGKTIVVIARKAA